MRRRNPTGRDRPTRDPPSSPACTLRLRGNATHGRRELKPEGVHANRMSAAAYADTQPVADDDTPEGRALNRRIEIALQPNLDELPDLSSFE